MRQLLFFNIELNNWVILIDIGRIIKKLIILLLALCMVFTVNKGIIFETCLLDASKHIS